MSANTLLRYRKLWLGLGLVIQLFILILSLWTFPVQLDAPENIDKLIHGVAFAFLMVWFTGASVTSGKSRYGKIFLLLLAYGALMEILQSFAPSRFMSLGDLVADVAGLSLGWLVARFGAEKWCIRLEAWLP